MYVCSDSNMKNIKVYLCNRREAILHVTNYMRHKRECAECS